MIDYKEVARYLARQLAKKDVFFSGLYAFQEEVRSLAECGSWR